jgi:hypothetical protein
MFCCTCFRWGMSKKRPIKVFKVSRSGMAKIVFVDITTGELNQHAVSKATIYNKEDLYGHTWTNKTGDLSQEHVQVRVSSYIRSHQNGKSLQEDGNVPSTRIYFSCHSTQEWCPSTTHRSHRSFNIGRLCGSN